MGAGEWGRNPAERAFVHEKFSNGPEHQLAYKKAIETLSVSAMDRKDPRFLKIYGADVVAQDTAEVQRIQTKFDERERRDPQSRLTREKATILHAMIHENGAAWLGDPRIQFITTDIFDDYTNGVDEIVAFPRNPGHEYVGLSVDVTFSSDLDDKIERIVKSIQSDELGRVKYAITPGTEGTLIVPRVIVGAHANTLDHNLLPKWLKPKVDLKVNGYRFHMIDELEFEADAFLNYARRLKSPRAIDRYGVVQHLLQNCRKNIGKTPEEVQDEIKENPMSKNIRDTIKHMTR